MKAIAVDLGGTNIKAAIVDKEQGILEQISTPTNADLGLDYLLNRIGDTIKELIGRHEIIGIGVGLPGMVNLGQTIVRNPPNLPGWEEVHAAEEISKRTNLPCRIENDANVAALGSLHFGEGRNFDNFVVITLGTGVGGGIIINKKLYKGSKGMAGELGHMIIDYHGPYSNSVTRGTLESYLGQRFLSRFATDLIMQHPKNILYKKFHKNLEKLEPVDLTNAANEGNELAIEILKKSGERLGYAIINYTHILDIRKYVLSGGVAKAGDWLFNPAREIIKKHMMLPFREGLEIVYENLGNDGALLGAAGLAFDSFA